MKIVKILSLVLVLLLLVAAFFPGNRATATETISSGDSDNGLEVRKEAYQNDDGTYTVQLEAFATGEKIISQIQKDIPTDIVLVQDQSSSMSEQLEEQKETVVYTEFTSNKNGEYYKYRHNGGEDNLYHQVQWGIYVPVNVDQELMFGTLTPTTNYRLFKYYETILYVKVAGKLQNVIISREVDEASGQMAYTYMLPNGASVVSVGDSTVPSFEDQGLDEATMYILDRDKTEYTYSYEQEGELIQIGHSVGDTTSFEVVFYKMSVEITQTKKIDSLKDSLKGFADHIAQRTKAEDGTLVDHRLAIVGFASSDLPYTYMDGKTFENTELFVGKESYQYGSGELPYDQAFQDVSTKTGLSNIEESIKRLSASGNTCVDLGLEMAIEIFNANPIPEGEVRNRVVVVFTDGNPGNGSAATAEHISVNEQVVDRAIGYSDTIKGQDYNAKVYTIGVFQGADPSSTGDSAYGENIVTPEFANWFLHKISSNNGAPQTPGYYKSALNAQELMSIFQQISGSLETGGSHTSLGISTVVRDVVTEYFQIPQGAEVRLQTAACIGQDENTYTWSAFSNDSMGATASIVDNQVEVTGFDFAANYVGTINKDDQTTYRGYKLIISFPIEAKPGFLGGNYVPTNEETSGVYAAGSDAYPVESFPVPTVDVPIRTAEVVAPSFDRYLLGSISATDIISGIQATVAGTRLDLTNEEGNYGLQTWQNEFVTIYIGYYDPETKQVTDIVDLTSLKDDYFYTIAVIFTPKTSNSQGVVHQGIGTAKGSIRVFKPHVNFTDGVAYYGDQAPTSFDGYASIQWLHGADAPTTDMGPEPELTMTYSPVLLQQLDNNVVNTKKDIAIQVTSVRVGETDIMSHVTFAHTPCDQFVTENLNGAHFLLHVKTGHLTIKMMGGDSQERYVLAMYRNGSLYTYVTIFGGSVETVYELPVGQYSFREDENWTWRYDGTTSVAVVDLTADAFTGEMTITNNQTTEQWLNGYNAVYQNSRGQWIDTVN